MSDLIELMFILLLAFILCVLVIGTPVIIIDSIACVQKYEDSRYKVPAGCMVMYQGEYISESLYQRAFEQNIKIK